MLLAGLSLVGLALLARLIDQASFYQGLGVAQPSVHIAIVLFVMIAPVFGVLLQPALVALWRRHEFEADNFAAEQAHAGSLIQALPGKRPHPHSRSPLFRLSRFSSARIGYASRSPSPKPDDKGLLPLRPRLDLWCIIGR